MQRGAFTSLKECAISLALSVGLMVSVPSIALPPNAHAVANPVIPDVSVLISGPPIKDPEALLRYALPIDNKAIREVQKPLEDITDSLKIAGVKALDSVERVKSFGDHISSLILCSDQWICRFMFCFSRNLSICFHCTCVWLL